MQRTKRCFVGLRYDKFLGTTPIDARTRDRLRRAGPLPGRPRQCSLGSETGRWTVIGEKGGVCSRYERQRFHCTSVALQTSGAYRPALSCRVVHCIIMRPQYSSAEPDLRAEFYSFLSTFFPPVCVVHCAYVGRRLPFHAAITTCGNFLPFEDKNSFFLHIAPNLVLHHFVLLFKIVAHLVRAQQPITVVSELQLHLKYPS